MRFAGNFPKENITYDNSVSDALKVIVLAVVPGTDLPLRDGEGKVVTTFKATEGLIHGAISSFRGGVFNLNHEAIPETMIGVYDSVIYDEGFKVSGSILCPIWKEKIISGDFSGVSIEGDIVGEMTNPDSMKISAISFLSEAEGACPLVDSEGNPVCKVEVIQDDEDLESTSIEAAWDGSVAERQIWNYATNEDGEVSPSKAKKCFLKIDGDSTRKGSYSYPYVTIIDGKPVPNRDGLLAALKFASGAMGATKDQSIIRKIKTIMNKSGMELPPSLQARLEQKSTVENGQQTIVASVFDPITDEVLDSQSILVINSIQGEHMTKKEEKTKVEASVAEIIPVVEVETPEIVASVPEAVVEAAVVDAPAAAAPVIEVPAPIVVEKTLDWSLVSQELGIKSKDEFTLIKDAAGKIPSLEEKIDGILKENESLKSFKIETEKNWLKQNYPPGVVSDIAAAHAEFTRDPASFVQKYAEDAYKFKASANVKLQGSASESETTEEARKMQARKEKRDKFLSATGGPAVR